jgi:1-acyl-sn-glycerol-3-phosphate acyltransferase
MDGNQQEPLIMKIFYPIIKYTLGTIVKLLWVDKVTGLENIPHTGGAIVVANHESYFDFLCFIAVSPRKVRYLAAEKFFTNPFWLPLMLATGQIKVERMAKDKSELKKVIAQILNDGQIVGIFPEGTRSRDGKMQRGFTGAVKFALEQKVPLIPVGVSGAYEIMTSNDKYPKLNKKASLAIGKPIWLDKFYDKECSKDCLQDLTDDVMIIIAKLAGKKYPYANTFKKLK